MFSVFPIGTHTLSMNSFQQICPSCRRQLELPAEARGQLAVCPACETQFEAAETPSAFLPTQSNVQSEATNEYQSVTIEAVFNETQAAHATRQLPFLVPFLIPSVLLLIGFIAPVAYLSDVGTVNQTLALQMLLCFSPLLLLPVAYAFWVAMNLVNRILDYHPRDVDSDASEKHWAKPRLRCFVAVYATVLSSCIFLSGVTILGVVIVNVAQSIPAPEVRLVVIGLTFVFGVIAVVGTMMRFWPLFPLSMTMHSPLATILKSLRISGANLMTSFFLVATICALLGIGTSFFGLGLPIAIPFSAMLVTVAHRMICEIPIRAMENQDG